MRVRVRLSERQVELGGDGGRGQKALDGVVTVSGADLSSVRSTKRWTEEAKPKYSLDFQFISLYEHCAMDIHWIRRYADLKISFEQEEDHRARVI